LEHDTSARPHFSGDTTGARLVYVEAVGAWECRSFQRQVGKFSKLLREDSWTGEMQRREEGGEKSEEAAVMKRQARCDDRHLTHANSRGNERGGAVVPSDRRGARREVAHS